MNLAVAPEHRRRGIATRLLERLFELTTATDAAATRSRCAVSNDVAIRLYEQAGFKARGVRRGYYTDNREDALDHVARFPSRDPRDPRVSRRPATRPLQR